MLLLALVQLHSQYQVLEEAIDTFLHAQLWLIELTAQVNMVEVLVVFTCVAC